MMSTTTDQQSPSRDGKADTVSEGTTSTTTTVVAPNDPLNSSPQSKQDNSPLTQTGEEEDVDQRNTEGVAQPDQESSASVNVDSQKQMYASPSSHSSSSSIDSSEHFASHDPLKRKSRATNRIGSLAYHYYHYPFTTYQKHPSSFNRYKKVYPDVIEHEFSFRSDSNSNFNSKVAQWNDKKALKSASSYLSLSAFGEEFQIGDDGLLSQSMFLDASLDDNYLERLCPDLDLIGHTTFSSTCIQDHIAYLCQGAKILYH